MAGPSDFYNSVYSTARELGANDVQARLAAAQASEETGFGKSMVGNNFFGVKAGNNYAGPSVAAGTNEEINGVLTPQQANFRAYDDLTGSVKDYLSTIQKSFPEAWGAETFQDAVAGLNNGVYGKYATNSNYGNNVSAIDNQYGGTSYAQNPNDVPTPYAPSDLTNGSLLSAFQANPQAEDPFASVLGGQPTAPVDVQASGILGGSPSLEASATARPMISVPATADLGTTPGLSASTTTGILSPSTAGFDQSRFDGAAPSVASDFDPGRFAAPETAAFDPSRFGTTAINPATNTQSFMDQPAAPADLGGFASAMATQRGAPTGILSADSQTVQGLAEKQLAEAALNQPSLSVPSAGILAGNSPLEAQATVPSLANAYVAPQSVTPAEQAIDNITTASTTPGILSGSLLSTANVPLSSSVTSSDLAGKSILAGQPMRQSAFATSFPSAVANNTIEPATVNDVVAAPTLETMEISEQPSVATIDGPTSTPAVEQQQKQAVNAVDQAATPQPTVQAAQNTKSFKDSLFSKETALGSILGGVLGGPVGGILGGLAGQQVAKGGGLTGLLGGGFMAPTTQIGSGGIGGIYGGQYAPGTFAMANNGAQITAQNGGYTSVTTPSGQREVVSPTGQISHNFGSIL